MLISNAALTGLYRSFNTIFQQAYTGTTPRWQKLAMQVPSSTKEETYAWLGSFPKMREWIGDRQVAKLLAHGYTIKNKSYESTVSVDRDDIEDDQYGVYTPVIAELGRTAATFPDDLVISLLLHGFENTCYDGQPFFANTHSDGEKKGQKQSNLGTKSLSMASYAAARASMMSLTDSYGKVLGINPCILVVPPQLESTARKILKADSYVDKAGSADVLVTNVYKDSAELLVLPELATNATAWFLLDTTRSVKPIIYQQRKAPQFVSLQDAKDQNVFLKKEYMYGVDQRCNAGYGLWQFAYGSTGVTA